MTDRQILEAALTAGLCLPTCWSLVDPDHLTDDISAGWSELEHEQMDKLRRLAALITERERLLCCAQITHCHIIPPADRQRTADYLLTVRRSSLPTDTTHD